MKKYPFRLVTMRGDAGLVEVVREGEILRCILPIELLANKDEGLSDTQLDMGIRYGVPFAEFLQPTPTKSFASLIEKSLHNAGVWTLEDLRTKPNQVIRVLQSVYGLELSSIIAATEEHLAKPHENSKPVVTPKVKNTKKEK
jgi:hypothetical protein